MQKTILALTCAAFSCGVYADVTLYGQIKSSVSTSQVKIKGDAGTEKSATSTRINDNTSRIGFKGKEKLSDNLTAIWQLEQRASILGQSNSQKWGSRDSFIGLEGSFGKLRAGNLNNMLNEMDTIDTWMWSNTATGLGVFTRTGSRNVSVRYDSLSLSGFQFNAQYAPRDNQNPADKYTHAEPGRDQYTAGVSYSNPEFFTKLAYNLRKNRVGTEDGHIVRLETAYDANNVFLGLGAQYAKANESANTYLANFTDGFNTYNGSGITKDAGKEEAVKVIDAAVTAGYNFGNWRPRITYVHGWPAKGVDSGEKLVDKFDQVIAGGDYRFSKRTSARGQVGYLRVGGKTRLTATDKGKVEQVAASLGLHHRF
ncbi:porin [Neisseria yangbaofengii]|uniref:porin n=1 Tax=Neisseria yangbaofengii TaxID=2709396 RepID=UPI0013EA1C01|nr:porin [Neisseria yangbaofengii]